MRESEEKWMRELKRVRDKSRAWIENSTSLLSTVSGPRFRLSYSSIPEKARVADSIVYAIYHQK